MINSDEFLMNKEDFVANALSAGVAVQLLVDSFGGTKDEWTQHIAQIVNSQVEDLTSEQIEQTVNDYLLTKNPEKPLVIQSNLTTGISQIDVITA